MTVGVPLSRTITAPAEAVSDAFTDEGIRGRWLPDAPISVRTANRGHSARFNWDAPPSLVGYNLFGKGDRKTQIGLSHEKLPDAATADELRAMWRERLAALKVMLEG